jgi:hypothetical protein
MVQPLRCVGPHFSLCEIVLWRVQNQNARWYWLRSVSMLLPLAGLPNIDHDIRDQSLDHQLSTLDLHYLPFQSRGETQIRSSSICMVTGRRQGRDEPLYLSQDKVPVPHRWTVDFRFSRNLPGIATVVLIPHHGDSKTRFHEDIHGHGCWRSCSTNISSRFREGLQHHARNHLCCGRIPALRCFQGRSFRRGYCP